MAQSRSAKAMILASDQGRTTLVSPLTAAVLARRFGNPDLATTLLIPAPDPLLTLPAASLGACLLA